MAELDGKEIGELVVKQAIEMIPIIGSPLAKIFDYWDYVKRKRFNAFTAFLLEGCEQNSGFDSDNIKTEEFIDVFASVIKKVIQTSQKDKQRRYRDILIRQMKDPKREIDNTDFFLDMIGELDELAIAIVKEHGIYESAFGKIEPIRHRLMTDINQNSSNLANNQQSLTTQEIESIKEENRINQIRVDKYNLEVTNLQFFRKAEYYNISEKDFLFYKELLVSKGLIRDNSVVGGSEKLLFPRITELGVRFLAFIMEGVV